MEAADWASLSDQELLERRISKLGLRLGGHGTRRDWKKLSGERAELKTFQETADRIVIAGGKKRQAALLGTKNKPDLDACPAFEIVLSKAANTQT